MSPRIRVYLISFFMGLFFYLLSLYLFMWSGLLNEFIESLFTDAGYNLPLNSPRVITFVSASGALVANAMSFLLLHKLYFIKKHKKYFTQKGQQFSELSFAFLLGLGAAALLALMFYFSLSAKPSAFAENEPLLNLLTFFNLFDLSRWVVWYSATSLWMSFYITAKILAKKKAPRQRIRRRSSAEINGPNRK